MSSSTSIAYGFLFYVLLRIWRYWLEECGVRLVRDFGFGSAK